MASLFSRIISGEIPCYKIAEDENCLAFLDIFPLVKGHTLVIPKTETDHLFDLDKDSYLKLQEFARKIAIGVQKAMKTDRVGVVVAGFEIPHAHIHLLPVNSMSQMHFTNPKLQLEREEFESIAAQIRQALT